MESFAISLGDFVKPYMQFQLSGVYAVAAEKLFTCKGVKIHLHSIHVRGAAEVDPIICIHFLH